VNPVHCRHRKNAIVQRLMRPRAMAKANLHPERSRTPRRWRCLGKGRHEAADRPGKVRPDHPMRGPASASVQLIMLHSRPPLRDAVPTSVRITSGSLPFDRNCPNRLQAAGGIEPGQFQETSRATGQRSVLGVAESDSNMRSKHRHPQRHSSVFFA
jgi:hypothetical protein